MEVSTIDGQALMNCSRKSPPAVDLFFQACANRPHASLFTAPDLYSLSSAACTRATTAPEVWSCSWLGPRRQQSSGRLEPARKPALGVHATFHCSEQLRQLRRLAPTVQIEVIASGRIEYRDRLATLRKGALQPFRPLAEETGRNPRDLAG
jgi:hypothetical protein